MSIEGFLNWLGCLFCESDLLKWMGFSESAIGIDCSLSDREIICIGKDSLLVVLVSAGLFGEILFGFVGRFVVSCLKSVFREIS